MEKVLGKEWHSEVGEEDKTPKSMISRTCHSFEKDSNAICIPLGFSFWGFYLRKLFQNESRNGRNDIEQLTSSNIGYKHLILLSLLKSTL